jgi:putative ABC transport system permease protein
MAHRRDVMPRLPRTAERLLGRALPARGVGESILGDLAEEYQALAGRRGARIARFWYWRQAVALATRYAWRRVRRRFEPQPTRAYRRQGDSIMDALWRDLRFGVRALVRQPGFAMTVVITLAVGLASNATQFSMVDALVLRPLPFRDVDRLVQVFGSSPQKNAFSERQAVSPADLVDWQRQTQAAEALVGLVYWDANITGTREPERVQAFIVSPPFFQALGLEVSQGRGFLAEEATEGRHRVAVLGHGLWMRKYASDSRIIGKTIELDREPYTIVGVGPAKFDYPMGAEVWTPLGFNAEALARRDRRFLSVIGRLADGRTVGELQAELATTARRLSSEYPNTNRDWSVNVMPLTKAVVDLGTPSFLAIWQASALMLLLMACVNVAGLLLVRGSSRAKELALRMALGAGRWRVVRQLLIESVVLSLVGVVLAVPLTWLALTATRNTMPARIARFVRGWDTIDVDLRLLAAMGALALVVAVLVGVLPALRVSRPALSEALKEGGRTSSGSGRQRLRSALVLAQVALALTLLVAAGLSVRGAMRSLLRDDGYDPTGVMTLRMTLPDAKYREEVQRRQFYERVIERVRAEPGVEQAGLVNRIPSGSDNASRVVEIDGRPVLDNRERREPDYRVITPNYLHLMRIPLASGRAFNASDGERTQPVAIVSRTMAQQYWPGENAVGKRLRFGRDGAWMTVVGMAADVRHDWFLNRISPTLYVPLSQATPHGMVLVLKGSSEPAALAQAGRRAVLTVDPDQPVYDVFTLNQIRWDRSLGLRFAAAFMGGFGIVGLLLAAVGVYGVMAYAVSERTHEIGVRVALGASRRDVLVSTMGRGLLVTAAGLAIGFVGAFALGKLMESALFGAIELDAFSFVVFPAVLAAVALVATIVPARRALRVDPIIALRGR